MAQRLIRKKVPDPNSPGKKVFGTVVKIIESEEPFSHAYLEDGTTLTAKMSFLEAIRLDDRWDNNGNPVYNITQQGSLIVSASEDLIKKNPRNVQ